MKAIVTPVVDLFKKSLGAALQLAKFGLIACVVAFAIGRLASAGRIGEADLTEWVIAATINPWLRRLCRS